MSEKHIKNFHFNLKYTCHIELCVVIVLSLLLLIIHITPKKFKKNILELEPVFLSFKVEEIPQTTQTVRRGKPAPEKPVIPLPVEELSLPEDATIDFTDIRWDFGDSPLGYSGLTTGRADTIPPRPLVQVMPEYPEELRKQKIAGSVRLLVKVNTSGLVEDVVVSTNSTGHNLCEAAAKEAALKSQYVPGVSGEEKIPMWIVCVYSFSPE
ncbi:TonB family protein [candidate division KSB1 bacterium]|nr:TonB family protein [candidate division KSB1 bacterium]